MSEQKLYTDKQRKPEPFVPGKSRLFTREEAIAKIVHDWHGKYGTTEEGAAKQLDDEEAEELRELTKAEYKKLSKSKKRGKSVKKGGKSSKKTGKSMRKSRKNRK